MKPIRKIALISPNPRLQDFQGRLLFMENVLPTIGTVLRDAGYEVGVFMEKIAPIPWERVFQADLVGFSAVTCTVNPAYEMAKKIKARKDVPIVLGGPHASMMPQDAIQHVDYVIREEGEETILELLEVLNKGGDVSTIKGLSYLHHGEAHHNPVRGLVKNFDTVPDLSLVHGYDKLSAFKLLLQAKGHVHFLETSRGCPYPCKFCWRIGGKTVRHRSFENVIADLKHKLSVFTSFPNWTLIIDSYFGVNRERSKEVLRGIVASGIKVNLLLFARCEIAEDLEMLDLMRKAGVKWIFMGIESIHDSTLNHFDKRQTLQKVRRSIKAIREHHIQVYGSFVLGSDDDPSDTPIKTVEFAREVGLTWVMFNILTDFQSGEGELSLPFYKIFQKDWDYYNLHYVIHYPKNMRASELQEKVIDAYQSFYSWRTLLSNLMKGRVEMAFYQWFRRFMIKPLLKEMKAYIPYLKKVEEGMYDASGRLMEEKLIPPQEREKDGEVVSQVA